jgi:hypothetical protein
MAGGIEICHQEGATGFVQSVKAAFMGGHPAPIGGQLKKGI